MSASIIVKELYPKVEKGLSNPDNTKMLKKAIEGYLDRNMDKLTTLGPVKQTVFTDYDQKQLYNAAEVDTATIISIVKKSKVVIGKWPVMDNPFNSASVLAIRYYMLKNNEDMVRAMLVYFTLSMYPSTHAKYYKLSEPNENIMNYTINNLSNKYKIRQMGTTYHTLIDTTLVCYTTNKDRLKRCNDKDILDFIQDVKTRQNSFMRKIANQFYIDHKEGKYLNLEVDNYDEDNFRESDSNSYAVERLTNAVTLKLSTEGPKIQLVNIAAKFCQVSVNELRNYVENKVNGNHQADIRKLVESILFLFIFDGHHTVQEVSSDRFFVYCMEMYRKSNTTDKNIIAVKKILDDWLHDLGTYKKTQRLATINDFRRALFTFIVFSIQTTSH
jgi:hypothetical protein